MIALQVNSSYYSPLIKFEQNTEQEQEKEGEEDEKEEKEKIEQGGAITCRRRKAREKGEEEEEKRRKGEKEERPFFFFYKYPYYFDTCSISILIRHVLFSPSDTSVPAFLFLGNKSLPPFKKKCPLSPLIHAVLKFVRCSLSFGKCHFSIHLSACFIFGECPLSGARSPPL